MDISMYRVDIYSHEAAAIELVVYMYSERGNNVAMRENGGRMNEG